MRLTIAQLAKRLGAELVGDGAGRISAVGAIEAADENTITFITSEVHKPKLEKSHAGAVIVAEHIEGLAKPQLIVKNVNAALIEVLNLFAPELKPAARGIDPAAKIGQNTKIDKTASIGPCVVIGDKVEIGPNSVIAGGCKIGENSKVGRSCRLDSNVVVHHNCTIGNNVIIQSNSTIGSIGFGYSFIDGSHRLIPHNGGVIIEDFVEIGANCCVDRAKFENTIIGAGTKIDNLVQIAHNVVIGKCCLLAGQVGISGSCRLGDGAVLAGQVGMADNVQIGEHAIIGAQSGVIGNIAAGQQVIGSPPVDRRKWLRTVGITKRLPKLVEQLRQLAAKVEKLEAAKDNKE